MPDFLLEIKRCPLAAHQVRRIDDIHSIFKHRQNVVILWCKVLSIKNKSKVRKAALSRKTVQGALRNLKYLAYN